MERPTISQRDLLLANKWTSLLFTTYSLSLSFLEAAALSAVARTYRDCTVLADIEGYRSSLNDVGAVEVGRRYDVVPIKVHGGIFHPKIAVLFDTDGNVRAAVGSGNLTFGGWGYNSEIVDVLVPGRDSTCFAELAQFIEFLNSPTARSQRLDVEHVPNLDQYVASCRKAARVPGADRSRFMHTLMQPLDLQLGALASELGGALALTVVSPFFSAHRGVERLASALSCQDISVAVTPAAPSNFDFEGSRKAGLLVSPVASDQFNDERTLHAKLFDIECRKGRMVVTGSPNATTAAMERNVEAVVVRIVDRDSSFGWKPSGTHSARTTDEPAPSEALGSCAIARVAGDSIVGRILGHPSPQGEWRVLLSSGVIRESAGPVAIDEVGRFRFDPPGQLNPILQSTSIQVVLEQDGIEIRGWLILQDLLKAIQEKGPIAHSIARMLSGIDTSADVDAVLEYFAKAPSELVDAAARQGGGRSDRKEGLPTDIVISSESLKPESAFDNPGTWSGGASSRSFASMIDALIRQFAASLPDQHDDAADDEDEDDAGGPAARGDPAQNEKSPARRGERVRVASVERAFSAMLGMLNAMPAGSARVPGLYVLFDMIVQILPRCDQGDELTETYLKAWLAAAQDCRTAKDAFDALDRCVSAVVTKDVMDNPIRANKAHMALQRWLGGGLDSTAIDALEPNVEGLDVSRLAPATSQEGWTSAWHAIVSTTTPWTVACAIQSSLRAGSMPILPDGTSSEEASVLRRIAAGELPQDRVVYLTKRRRGHLACPRCNMQLPRSKEDRLKSLRIETCGDFRCGRLIINVCL